MVRTKEELINSINAIAGETPSDEVIALVEDVNDTMAQWEGAEDWKTKYEENDAMWRQKYLERFTDPTPQEDSTEYEETETEKTTFEELFEEVK